MIRTRDEYLQAEEALRDLEDALMALRAKLGEQRAGLFVSMAQDYLKSIAAIRLEIDDYTGLSALKTASAPLWLGLDGADLSPENVRTSLLAGWLERLRKSVATVTGYGVTGSVPRCRFPQEILEACDFKLIGFQPGSLKIGLDVVEPAQLALFQDAIHEPMLAARKGLEKLLEAAAEAEELQRRLPASEVRRESFSAEQLVLFRQVLRLTPGKKERVRAVIFEGALVPRRVPVRLVPSLRPLLASLLGGEEEPGQVEELEGTLREIDLDQMHFIIREQPDNLPDTKVYFKPSLLEEAKMALDRRVRVEASRGTGTRARLRALVVEVLENDGI